MGTNYYLNISVCKCCRKPVEVLHIGKSSAGWKFAFKTYKDLGISTVADWVKLIESINNEIVDSCGDKISSAGFIDFIDSKIDGKSNGAFGFWCDGKYDYSEQDFS